MQKLLLSSMATITLLLGNAQGQSINNSGFESNSFSNPPGYISGNSAITGWTASANDAAGLNPSGSSPFANNGTIPEGSNVAFIQADGASLTTMLTSTNGITGLVIGQTYRLQHRVNSRLTGGNNTPEMGLIVGGTKVIRNDVSSVGGTNPYKLVSYDFVATANTMSLAVDSSLSGTGTDETLLIDAFTVAQVNPRMSINAWDGDATSGINSALTYTHAFNLGTSAANATVNGVSFTGVAGGNPSVGGSFSYNMNNSLTDTNNITGDSATLASGFVFGNNSASLVLEGLTMGETYLLSVFSVGFDAGQDYGRTSTIVGADGEALSVSVNAFGNNNGLRFDYEYTATGTSETIDFSALSDSETFHTYAFANAIIPEPGAFAGFAGLLGLGYVIVRRRKAL